MNNTNKFITNQMQNDMSALLALRDARAQENADARRACQENAQLCRTLLSDAQRRGQTEIDWPEYFRNLDINYP